MEGDDTMIGQWFNWKSTTTNASNISYIEVRLWCNGLIAGRRYIDLTINNPNGTKNGTVEPTPYFDDGSSDWTVNEVKVSRVKYSDGTVINYFNGEQADATHLKPKINLTCHDCEWHEYFY
jgi:hypothetical protein